MIDGNIRIQEWSFSDAVEIDLPTEDSFLKIKETLTRIGIASEDKKRLYQVAHILHKRGRYFIVHYNLLYQLDGRDTKFDIKDLQRQNTIANLLEQWKLLSIVGYKPDKLPLPQMKLRVIGYKEKDEWELLPVYQNLGKYKSKT